MTQDTDAAIVQTFNKHLNVEALHRELGTERWNRFIELLDAQMLVFSGEPTGFHLRDEPGSDTVIDCAADREDDEEARIIEAQHHFILGKWGHDAADSANYGWGVAQNSVATKVYGVGEDGGHQVVVSEVDAAGEVYHEVRDY